MLSRVNRLYRKVSGTIYTNQHIKAEAEYENKKYAYDFFLTNYDDLSRAYLTKRRTTKSEIWPKAYIMEETPGTEASLSKQALPYLKNLLDINTMGRMNDMGQLAPQFIMSALFEEGFKPFLDEVCRKTVMNGDQVPMEQARTEENNRNKLIELFRVFHYGDEMSELETLVERGYLQAKFEKFEKYNSTGVRSWH